MVKASKVKAKLDTHESVVYLMQIYLSIVRK